ncbi:MAG: hypothetical protein N3Z29_01425, partial [Synechococcaceae cyanobacterium MAG-AL1]|nr:hypothetical protein [Candidatus Regnicoccus frigidus MAG-AL1]
MPPLSLPSWLGSSWLGSSWVKPSWFPGSDETASAQTALSRNASIEGAVDEVVQNLDRRSPADLALVFCASSYASDLPRLLPLLRAKINARHWIGCAGGGVVGSDAQGAA